ncbi:hypothetical protein J2Y45_002273 [Dyadobacter sp. BE34]|uniref:DUF3823 domain-containing protein n=1 Tax=Dyadobacter fermentans TaxID=94254 RepID=A0ABU1QWE3_9BACT|nr:MULTISPECIES: DUF3823 domain-containing protein [Dyadobacter]MDR6805418.1 hypothetical protein [Dyadobacter fermentans]MDR7042822.1 hypothetical protein [Dyadobacter sp. BE242]MDR7197134.1 hypothetical protein [Dyadobacter sp. BE34]MDR7215431.1 hypothetical protein [Dyadobacter sp. BE31]MDR7262967.1 hypothetical protein [Dyadobacter sp. BE32]
MKQLFPYIPALLLLFGAAACSVDNYPAPDSQLYGTFLDAETNEPVEQDIIRGSTIEYIEHGYASNTKQTMIIKNDGSYRNNLIFANTYTITPVRGNFVAMAAQEVIVKGETKLDFKVQPYIRVKEASIEKVGTKIVAKFKLQQTVMNNVRKIGLYAHPEPSVGEPMRVALAEQEINGVIDPNKVYQLEIDLPSNSNVLKTGNQYFFRAGGIIDAPESKFNYAKAVRIAL